MPHDWSRRDVLAFSGAAVAAATLGGTTANAQPATRPADGARPPNILVYMTDQQRGDSIAPYHRARTPNLDRFCQQGVTFSRASCPSPHCCPSRATFFTGLYPSEHGVWNNVDVGNALSRGPFPGTRLFSDDLKAAGYDLDFAGKWHVSSLDSPADRGWRMGPSAKQPTLAAAGTIAPQEASDWHQFAGRPPMHEWNPYKLLAPHPDATERHEAQVLRPGYGTYTHYGEAPPDGKGPHANNFDRKVLADALQTIRQRKPGGNPWCQYVGVIGPHDPYYIPKEYLDLYPIDEVRLPESYGDRMLDKPALYRRTRDRFDQLPEAEQRQALRHYLAYCTYADALFGEVLKALDESGEAERTLVLYTSDHGDYAADHGLWCKGLPCFRGAYHIPAAVRWPGGIKQPGRVADAFVSTADFAPTILEAAGVTVQRPMTGRSLMPFLRNDPRPADWRDAIFTQSNGNELYGIQRSVTTDRWKYVYNGFDYDELYDLKADPHEMKNVAADPANREVLREMCHRMWRFAFEHKDAIVDGYVMVAHAPFGPAEAFRDGT